jgi:hypothetical protein
MLFENSLGFLCRVLVLLNTIVEQNNELVLELSTPRNIAADGLLFCIASPSFNFADSLVVKYQLPSNRITD